MEFSSFRVPQGPAERPTFVEQLAFGRQFPSQSKAA